MTATTTHYEYYLTSVWYRYIMDCTQNRAQRRLSGERAVAAAGETLARRVRAAGDRAGCKGATFETTRAINYTTIIYSFQVQGPFQHT
jgi:hypothetical protein